MGNIVDYVKETSEVTFKEKGFTTEDALVLSEFCYLKFEGMVGGTDESEVSLLSINERPEKENLFLIKAYEKDNRALYDAIIQSKRFNGMKLSNYVNRIDLQKRSQFAAITFSFDEDIYFVAYRGTDETMVGWKEDFAFASKKPIKGQTLSARYLSEVWDKIQKPIYIGGHSKGGNLAIYAALTSNKKVRKNLINIYSFDGPGYRPEFLEKEEADLSEIYDRIIKIIPKGSPIGMLLLSPFNVTSIDAKSVGMRQHNIYNWMIKNGKLKEAPVSEQHLLSMKTVNDWLLGLDDEGIENFINTFCNILDATSALTTTEFRDHAAEHTKALINDLDDETKEMVTSLAKSYFGLAGEIILEDVRGRGEAFKEDMKERSEAFLDELKEKTDEMIKKMKQ